MPRSFNRTERDDWLKLIRSADLSMPPEGEGVPQTPTAQPYNPGAYEGMVEGMHPAAQYAYERAVQQGAPPEAAMAAAQGKQSEMVQRSTEGQDVNGVKIPVIGKTNPVAEIIKDNFGGWVPVATVQRVSKLL